MKKSELLKKGLNALTTQELELIIGSKFTDVAVEYARRKRIEAVPKKVKITCSLDAHNLLTPYYEGLSVEHFYIILLNRANQVISVENISQGGVSATLVDPKVIFNKAVKVLASGIILSHNHPSENCKPSQSDMELTRKIKEGGKLLEISVLDHVIHAGSNFYSFADSGDM